MALRRARGRSRRLPTFLISRFARQSVTVALSGEGADELLGGYPRYAWATRAQRAQQRVPATLARALARSARLLRTPERRRYLRLLCEPMTPTTRHVAWTGGATRSQRSLLLRTPSSAPLPHTAYLGAGTSVHDLMAADLATWLVDDVLMKADKMSMAASLELRVPFLDHRVVEFVTSLPEALKRPVPVTKPLLRTAMQSLVPHAALRAPKHAFSVPVAEWLRGDLRDVVAERLLSPCPSSDHGFFHRTGIRRLWDEHLSAQHNHASILWSLLCFETWYHEVFLQPGRAGLMRQPEGACA